MASALSVTAYCRASSSATYSATLLSWRPIFLAILILPPSDPSITTPIPDGPGFPREPPSIYATRVDIRPRFPHHASERFLASRCLLGSFPRGSHCGTFCGKSVPNIFLSRNLHGFNQLRDPQFTTNELTLHRKTALTFFTSPFTFCAVDG